MGPARLGIEDHADVGHAPLRLGPFRSLHHHARGIQADVGARFAIQVFVPWPHRLWAENRAGRQTLSQTLTGCLRGALHRRFRQAQARRLGQGAVGHLAEGVLNAEQRDDFLRSRRQSLG